MCLQPFIRHGLDIITEKKKKKKKKKIRFRERSPNYWVRPFCFYSDFGWSVKFLFRKRLGSEISGGELS